MAIGAKSVISVLLTVVLIFSFPSISVLAAKTDKSVQKGNDNTLVDESIQEHLDFISSPEYKKRMDNTWAALIYDGLNGFGARAAEGVYDILDTPADILNFQKASVFNNPYDEIVMILIRAESGFSKYSIELEYDRELYNCICDVNEVRKRLDPDWEMDDLDFFKQFTDWIHHADAVERDNYDFYEKLTRLFSGNEEIVKDALNYYGNITVFFEGIEDSVKILNAIYNAARYDATVKAYINSSDTFKQLLDDIEKTMEAEGESHKPKGLFNLKINQYAKYAQQFKKAKDRYDRFITDDFIAKEILAKFQSGSELIEDSVLLFAQVFDDFAETVTLKYLTNALKLTESQAQYVFAVVQAYKTGWAISEGLTNNETNMECRELARAYYYLENALIQNLEDYESKLVDKKEKGVSYAFDTGYRTLQTLECATLANYKKYLEAQDEALIRRFIHLFTKNNNNDEIELCEDFSYEWEKVNCHEDVDGYFTDGSTVTKIRGKVVDKNGKPASGLYITISMAKNGFIVYKGETDLDGCFKGTAKVGEVIIEIGEGEDWILRSLLGSPLKKGENDLGTYELSSYEGTMIVAIDSSNNQTNDVKEKYEAFISSQKDALGYRIYDIDKDGRPEVFLDKQTKGDDRDHVTDIYTYKQGEFVFLHREYGPMGHGTPDYASYPNGHGVLLYEQVKAKELIQLHTWIDSDEYYELQKKSNGMIQYEDLWIYGEHIEKTVYLEDAKSLYYNDIDDQRYRDSKVHKAFLNHQYYQSENSSPFYEGSYLLAQSSIDDFTALNEAFDGIEPEAMVGNGVDDNSYLGVVSLSENVSQEVQTQSSGDSFEVRYESYINNNDGTVDLKLTVDDMTESYRLEGIWCVSVEDVYVADINIADSFSNIIVTVGGEDEDCKTYIYAFDKHQIGQVIDYRGRIVPDSINGNGTVSLSYIIGMGIQDYGQFTVRPELMVYSLGARVYVDLFSGRTIYSESGSTYEDGFDVTITSDLSVYSNALYDMSSSGVIPAGSTVNCEYTSKGEYDYALYVSCGDVQGYVSNQMLKECCEGMYFAG